MSNKGQTNSKWFFQADISSIKRTNKFDFTTCQLVFVRFLKKVKTTKIHFKIIWPLVYHQPWFIWYKADMCLSAISFFTTKLYPVVFYWKINIQYNIGSLPKWMNDHKTRCCKPCSQFYSTNSVNIVSKSERNTYCSWILEQRKVSNDYDKP